MSTSTFCFVFQKKMSIQLGDLCSLILNEHFGETVEKVGRDLFRGGQKPLKLICSSTGLGLNDVSSMKFECCCLG